MGCVCVCGGIVANAPGENAFTSGEAEKGRDPKTEFTGSHRFS